MIKLYRYFQAMAINELKKIDPDYDKVCFITSRLSAIQKNHKDILEIQPK
jgi:hypothetical protein